MIAVTGATGALGGRVAHRLAARGAPLRLIVRHVSRAPRLTGADVAIAAVEPVAGHPPYSAEEWLREHPDSCDQLR